MSATVLYRTWLKTKEAITMENNSDTEAERRPRIYPDIRVQDGRQIEFGVRTLFVRVCKVPRYNSESS